MNPFKAISSWFSGFFDKRLWHSPGGGRSTTSKEVVSEETSLNYSAVWAGVRLISTTAASLPLPIYKGLDSEEREKDRSHPVYRLLNVAPNPEQTANSFRAVMTQWQVLWGNAYAEIIRESGDPTGPVQALWPIHPARVKVCRDDGTDALFYEVRDGVGGRTVELEPWQMLHLPSIITTDGICGRGMVTHARETIGGAIAAEKFNSHTYVSGIPKVAIEMQQKWDEDTRKAFRKEWAETYDGVDNTRVALIQGGGKIVPMHFNAEDQQFLESRQFSIEEIARWLYVPPHMLMHMLRATFSNIEHLSIEFVKYSLIPWLRIWEAGIAQKLLTPKEQGEYFAEHIVDGLLRGDSAARAAYYNQGLNGGWLRRNEVRKKENLPPVPGGDVFLVQGATVPLGDDGKPQSEFVKSNEPPKLPAPDDEPMEETKQRVADKVKRVLRADLSRILSKESKAMTTASKKPNEFAAKMEVFFQQHETILTDATTETLAALAECGLNIDAKQFVADWLTEAKNAAIQTVTSNVPIPDAVGHLVNSTEWTNRPQRAIERLAI